MHASVLLVTLEPPPPFFPPFYNPILHLQPTPIPPTPHPSPQKRTHWKNLAPTPVAFPHQIRLLPPPLFSSSSFLNFLRTISELFLRQPLINILIFFLSVISRLFLGVAILLVILFEYFFNKYTSFVTIIAIIIRIYLSWRL